MFATLLHSPYLQAGVDFASLVAVLTWISLAGGPYLAGWVFALLAENWPQWHDLPRQVKFAAPLVVSVALSIGANLLLQQNEVVSYLDPWYRMIAVAVLAYLGSQVAYMKAKKSDYAVRAKTGDPAVYVAEFKDPPQ